MTTLEEPWCSGLGAEPRPGPGYMRPSLGHDDRETEDPSNISSGLTAFACVSLSPGVQQEPPSRAAYQPQTLEQAWRGSQEGGVLARSSRSCHQIGVWGWGPGWASRMCHWPGPGL